MDQAWRVASWPPVLWQADAAVRLDLVHLATHVETPAAIDTVCAGQTIWGAAALGGPAAMAWDWVQIPQGVVALADPLAVLTNLRLLDDDGHVLSRAQAVRHLNGVLNALPWQAEVERALERQPRH